MAKKEATPAQERKLKSLLKDMLKKHEVSRKLADRIFEEGNGFRDVILAKKTIAASKAHVEAMTAFTKYLNEIYE